MDTNMIEWLLNNKEWLFSGLGIAIFTFLFKREKISKLVTAKRDINVAKRDIIYNLNSVPSPRDEPKPKEQSAAFCYKKMPELKVLLVKTSGRKWTFPKGTNVEGMSNYATARINALEEAGVQGQIEKHPFSKYLHYKQELKNDGEECENSIYFLKVDKEAEPTEDHRHPTWFTLEKAAIALSEGRDTIYATEFSRVIQEAKHLLTR